LAKLGFPPAILAVKRERTEAFSCDIQTLVLVGKILSSGIKQYGKLIR